MMMGSAKSSMDDLYYDREREEFAIFFGDPYYIPPSNTSRDPKYTNLAKMQDHVVGVIADIKERSDVEGSLRSKKKRTDDTDAAGSSELCDKGAEADGHSKRPESSTPVGTLPKRPVRF